MSGLNNIIFNKGEGGLGAPLPGEDQYSGILFYSDADLPSGFDTDHRIKKVFSLAQAESLGITYGHINEVLAVGTITCTGDGQVPGDNLVITIVDDEGNTINLGTLISAASAGGASEQAAEVNALINSGTSTHGFSSTVDTAEVTLIPPAGSGQAANNYTIAVTITGGSTVTVVQFSGGEESDIDPMWYQIREFFRMQPKGVLWIGIFATADDETFASVTTMQQFADGKIRQLGIWYTSQYYAPAYVTTLQAVADALEAAKMPVSILLGANYWDDVISDLESARTLDSANVSVIIGQDGSGIGNMLFRAGDKGYSIAMVGTTLGAVALAKVNESVEWVAKFNMNAGAEFDKIDFVSGEHYADIPRNQLDQLNDYGYIFAIKYVMISGSYFSGSNTSTAITSDYAKIENVRTIDKSERNIYAFMLPALGSPLTVDADGKLSLDTIGYFESLATRALEQMQRDGELSSLNVIIDPDQDVLGTGELVITEQLVPKGVARQIVNNIGFVTKIS